MIVQQFQAMYKVAELALGEGKSGAAKVDANTDLVVPKSAQELEAAFYKVF
jgi:hypothetical protein